MDGSLVTLLHSNKRSVYVLVLFLFAHLLNQLDRYSISVTSQPVAQALEFGDKGCMIKSSNYKKFKKYCRYEDGSRLKLERSEEKCVSKRKGNITICQFDFDGTGFEYQILVGPAFTAAYTSSRLILGVFGRHLKRTYVLAACVIIWSSTAFLTGFVKRYWQLVAARFISGIGEAGCTPFATSLIGDYFSENVRGTALGVYNWGIYFGYSSAFALGNYIPQLSYTNQGWRWVFFIAGIPGIIVGLLILFTVEEPKRGCRIQEKGEFRKEESFLTFRQTITLLIKTFLRPSSLLLLIASSVRNAGGYVWAYNTQPFFNLYHPDVNVGAYMSWIPLVGGSLGVFVGGWISDRLVKGQGCHARLWVLILSQICASPFAVGVLYLQPPWAFLSLIPCIVIGEMWIGVTFAVVIELVPSVLRASAVALFATFITVIGGNVPLLVPLISHWTSFRIALYILYPGLYATSSVLFFLTLFLWKRDLANSVPNGLSSSQSDEIKPLLAPDKSS